MKLTGKMLYEAHDENRRAWEELLPQTRALLEKAATRLNKQLHLEEIETILKMLVETDTTYYGGVHEVECVFCNGMPGDNVIVAFKHQEQCPISIAKRLMKETTDAR